MKRFLFLLLLLASLPLHAEKIHIVTRNVEPFSFQKDGLQTGYSIELWEALARETGLEYDLQSVETPQAMIDALQNKTAEVAVGALSITAQRDAVIDFTQPFYESGLQILVVARNHPLAAVWEIVGNFFNLQVLGIVVALLAGMLFVSHLVWRFEHPVNEGMWPRHYWSGLWESFWWTVSIFLVGGADNKGPVGVGGRIVAIVWMFMSVILISFLTASFTTSMTVSSLKSDIGGPGDLPGHLVATIGGSTSEAWLHGKGIEVRPFPDIQQCVSALKSGGVQAVVFDAPILRYTVKQLDDSSLQIVGPVFEKQNYGLGVQQNSPLRKRLNQALLVLNERGFLEDLRKKWFGSDQ